MKSYALVALPVVLGLVSAVGCSMPANRSETSAAASEDVTACPAVTDADNQNRAAATVAFQIMVGAAKFGGGDAPVWSNTILSSQRYRLTPSGTAIEFEPADPLYAYVSQDMKAKLAIAQLDSSVAKYLSDALKMAFATTTGDRYASIHAVAALANFHYPGTQTFHVPDMSSANDSHYDTVSGSAWCGTSIVTIQETVQQSWQYAPIYKDSIFFWNNAWLSHAPAAFTGTLTNPSIPFNGPTTTGNPYLVVTVNGAPTNWSVYDTYDNTINCWQLPNETCTGTMEIDPIPYTQPGAYYDTYGNIVGTQGNPFALVATAIYADPSHAGQWAMRTVAGVQQWGTFQAPTNVLGTTVYQWVKQS
jgi:hypothetical protein